MEPAASRSRAALAIELVLLLAVLAFAVEFSRRHQSMNLVHPPASLERLSDYTAEIPYQNRVLVPTLVRAIDRSGLSSRMGMSPMQVARWIDALCVVAFFHALRALLARFLAGRWRPAAWAVLGLYALPFLYLLPRIWPYWYPWDLPATLFTTLGVLWIREQRWAWYYWVFPFATLNRETTLFLIVVFALTQRGEMKWTSLVLHLAAQAAIWLAIKWLLNQSFAQNGGVGEFYGDAVKDNLDELHEPATWGTLAMTFGFLWAPLLVLAWFVRERFVRRTLWVVPIFFAVSFAMAVFSELRIYGEMLPLVVLGVACGFEGWRARRATAPSIR